MFCKKSLVLLRPLLKSTVHKRKVFIFNCKQDEEPHVHIVEINGLSSEKEPSQ